MLCDMRLWLVPGSCPHLLEGTDKITLLLNVGHIMKVPCILLYE
jgi:hypothetical protein